MKRDEMQNVLGFEPNRTLRLMILKDVKEKGISIGEATSKYQLPAMFIRDKNGLIEVSGVKMTPAEFSKKHPYRKFVTID